jgi:hypothetical protein
MDYKVLFIPCFGDPSQFEKEFETHKEAETALNAIAEYTLMLHECSFMPDFSNTGMVLRKDDDGDWVEIDGDGEEL